MYTRTQNFKLKDKILLTGGSGFVGKNLIFKLKKKNILVLTRKNIPNKKNIRFIKANIFNKQKIKKNNF